MPDTIIKGVKEGFEEIKEEVKDQVKDATVGVVKNIPQQILGGGDNSGQPPTVEPPTDQEVIEHLYGAIGKPKLNKQQVSAKAQNQAVADARRKQRIRQTLKAMLQTPTQPELTEAEILEQEKRKEEEEKAKKAKEEQLPPLIEPSTAPKKGIFGLFMPRGKKGKKIQDLQTSVEKRMPGGGIA